MKSGFRAQRLHGVSELGSDSRVRAWCLALHTGFGVMVVKVGLGAIVEGWFGDYMQS